MLTYHRTSILTSRAQTVVNTVNTVGVMGKGLASEFKSRYPEMFLKYKEYCDVGLFDIGKLWIWKGDNQWVLNFPTKKHWRNPSRIDYVEAGLRKFVSQYEAHGITEIAFPRLGCGNGNLDWSDVRPLMDAYLSNLPIPVYIHDFQMDLGLPEHKEARPGDDLLAQGSVRFDRSFLGFQKSVSELIDRNGGRFRTIKRGTGFSVSEEADGCLKFSYGRKVRRVSWDDLFEVWDMLMKGPVTKEQVSGAVWQAAYCVFSLLAALPSIRPIQVASRSGKNALAIELVGDTLRGAAPIHNSAA